jgi:hypothetical protein
MLYGIIYIPNATSFGALIRAVSLGAYSLWHIQAGDLGDDSTVHWVADNMARGEILHDDSDLCNLSEFMVVTIVVRRLRFSFGKTRSVLMSTYLFSFHLPAFGNFCRTITKPV